MPVTNVKSRWVDGNLIFEDKDGNEIVSFDGTNRKVVIPSGSELETTGAISASDVADGSITLAKMADLASARVIVGNGASPSRPTAVLVGGDVVIAANGAATIQPSAVTGSKIAAATITSDKLANGAGVAALLELGLGVSGTVDHADDAAVQLAASAGGARAVLVVAVCTESLAGSGQMPTFSVGEADGLEKFLSISALAGATTGQVFVGAGALTATKALIVNVVDGAGNPAGKFAVTALILPAA
jgi:hypothetical protein